MNPIRTRQILAGLAGLSILGGAAACATDTVAASEDTSSQESTTESSESTGSTDTESSDSSSASTEQDGDYVDGTYAATGSYVSPGGQESIEVELTISDDVVTDVEVTSLATNSNSVRYQAAFIGGIADEVVGVDIDSLAVDKVSGSSLTSDGFDDALEQIKEQARA